MSRPDLRSRVIRLAHSKPELRAYLLPMLKQAAPAADLPAFARTVASALNSALRSLGSQTDEAQVNEGGKEVEGAYRSNLPKEGASAVGESRYDEMVEKELARARPVIERALKPFEARGVKFDLNDGEKGWIYVYVTLK